MGRKEKHKPLTKTCIRCDRTLPLDEFWSKRPTCADCARELWYAPKPKVDITKSINWPMMERMMRLGLISYPEEAFNNDENSSD
jgi:hypothetical protein